MTVDVATAYLRKIETALVAHDEQVLLSAVSDFVRENPAEAGLLIWSRFSSVEEDYFQRVFAYALAKTAAYPTRYLWAPLARFVHGAVTDDEAALTNVLTALQLHHDPDEVWIAVLAPSFGSFVARCAESGPLALEALCGLLLALADRHALTSVLTRAQADLLREELVRASESHKIPEADATVAALRRRDFPRTLEDRTERLDLEEAAIASDDAIDASIATQLRSVLANASAQYALRRQADEANGVIEEIALNGGEAAEGRLMVDTLEKLIHVWKTAIREGVLSIAPDIVPNMTTSVLAPARGSFVLRFLVQAPQPNVVARSFDELARVAENPSELISATQLSNEAKGNVVQFLDLLTQKKLDATLGLIDPQLFERRRHRVSSKHVAPILKRLREAKRETTTPHQLEGTLEGASHRQGTFEIQTTDLGTLRGDVPAARRPLLLRKVIGERYVFVLQESLTIGIPGEERRHWTLVSIRGAGPDEAAEVEAPKAELKELTSTDEVPQQDRLDRIVEVVRIVADDEGLTPKKLGMPDTLSSRRHIDYMRQGARVLGLLARDGTITPSGRTLSQLPDSRILDFLSVRFEVSVVGRLWKRWAKVKDLHHLDPESAENFLLSLKLSASMAERRGRTLRKWLLAFKSLRK